MLNLRLEGKQPIYEQLYSGIARLISTGELKPEEKLPAVREVAKQFGINPNTVQKAYSQLEQAGLIHSVPAKGSYVSAADSAADALRKDALQRLKNELLAAYHAGITPEQIKTLTDEVWGDGKDGNT